MNATQEETSMMVNDSNDTSNQLSLSQKLAGFMLRGRSWFFPPRQSPRRRMNNTDYTTDAPSATDVFDAPLNYHRSESESRGRVRDYTCASTRARVRSRSPTVTRCPSSSSSLTQRISSNPRSVYGQSPSTPTTPYFVPSNATAYPLDSIECDDDDDIWELDLDSPSYSPHCHTPDTPQLLWGDSLSNNTSDTETVTITAAAASGDNDNDHEHEQQQQQQYHSKTVPPIPEPVLARDSNKHRQHDPDSIDLHLPGPHNVIRSAVIVQSRSLFSNQENRARHISEPNSSGTGTLSPRAMTCLDILMSMNQQVQVEHQMPHLPESSVLHCKPTIHELSRMSSDELASVHNFTLIHPQYGCVQWQSALDLRGANLAVLASFKQGSIEVSPAAISRHTDRESHPIQQRAIRDSLSVASESSMRIQLSLERCFPKKCSPRAFARYRSKLMRAAERLPSGHFVSYNQNSGLWIVQLSFQP
jgi:Nucleoporin autopeptidase